MPDSPATHPSLLLRLRNTQDRAAWSQFVDVYAPLIYGYLRKRGLQDADAADLTQEALRVVAVTVKRLDYDPARGSFRGWLFTVVRNKLRNHRKRQDGRCQASGAGSQLQEIPAREDEQGALWDQEYQRRLLVWAAQQVRDRVEEKTWQAFWQTSVEGSSAKETAERLGMTVAAVYMAKSRVIGRLKEQVRQLEDQ